MESLCRDNSRSYLGTKRGHRQLQGMGTKRGHRQLQGGSPKLPIPHIPLRTRKLPSWQNAVSPEFSAFIRASPKFSKYPSLNPVSRR